MSDIERPSTENNPHPRTTAKGATPAALASKHFESEVDRRAYDEAVTRRRLRMALGVAVVVHAFLLAVHLPERTRALPPPIEEEELFVVQELRFKEPPPEEPPPPPPPPEREPEPPRPDARSVPIPDPEPERLPDPPPAPEPPPMPVIEPLTPVEPAPPVEIHAPSVAEIVEIPPPPPPPPPPTPSGPIYVTGDVRAPVKLRGPEPSYTEQARRARIEGVVVVQAVIDRQGNVTQVKILRDLPMGLGRAAEQAVKDWKFQPATLEGRPVEVYFNLTVNFQLN